MPCMQFGSGNQDEDEKEKKNRELTICMFSLVTKKEYFVILGLNIQYTENKVWQKQFFCYTV